MNHLLKIEDRKFDYEKFKIAGEVFFRELCLELKSKQVPIHEFEADHLCFRVQNQNDYAYYKNFLCETAILLTESIVNGRPICTFKLQYPFIIDDKVIDLVELPAPKAGAHYKTGFEHAEFVISERFDHFKEKFSQLNLFEDSEKFLNAELIYRSKNATAKFHHLSLERVIEIESAKICDVVFDFDGTIIISREQIYEINRIVFSQVLERHVSLEEAIFKFHPEFSKLFDAFAVTCENKKSSAVQLWGEVAKGFSPELFDGILELLEELKNRNKYRLHLWTARDEHSARRILSMHNIEHFFTTTSFASSTYSKPHSNSLNFNWRSSSKNSILVIGDSPSDIDGAKNIGAIAAAALWDPNTCQKKLIAAGAELQFREPKGLSQWLS